MHTPAWFIDDRIELQPVRRMPQLLRVGLVSDPWSWYTRLYILGMQGGPRAKQALRAWGRGSLHIRDVIWGMTHPEKLIEIPRPLGVIWEPDEDGGWQGLLASSLGLCGFTILFHYGRKREWKDPQYSPFWAVDLLLDANAPGIVIDHLLSKPASLEPRPPPLILQGSFDGKMLEWIAQADRPLVSLMQYDAPFKPAFLSVSRVIHLGTMRTGGTRTE